MINFMHVHWNVVHYCTGLQPAAMWKLRSPRRMQAEAGRKSSLFVHSFCTKQFFLITWMCHCVVLHHLQRREPVHTIIARMV